MLVNHLQSSIHRGLIMKLYSKIGLVIFTVHCWLRLSEVHCTASPQRYFLSDMPYEDDTNRYETTRTSSSHHSPTRNKFKQYSTDYTSHDPLESSLLSHPGYENHEPVRVEHYPVLIHSTSKSTKSFWDSLVASLPSILISLLTTPMLITLLMHVLKQITMIQNVINQSMISQSNMNSRETFNRADEVSSTLDQAIKKFTSD